MEYFNIINFMLYAVNYIMINSKERKKKFLLNIIENILII